MPFSTNELHEEEEEEEEKSGGFPGQSGNDYLTAISPQSTLRSLLLVMADFFPRSVRAARPPSQARQRPAALNNMFNMTKIDFGSCF